MKTLFVLNAPPYGTELSYNGLRLAGALAAREGQEVKVFLMGDAASCAKKDQKVPQGYYNIEVMLKSLVRRNSGIGVCGTEDIGCPACDPVLPPDLAPLCDGGRCIIVGAATAD